LFPKFPRATRTGEKLQSALDRILELANAAKEQAAEVDAEADIAADSDSE
jgi:hypothetical protein